MNFNGQNIGFYLIHGLEKKRKKFMDVQLRHNSITPSKVKWLLYPNKDDDLPAGICINSDLTRGQVAITYKHYLALKEVALGEDDVAVIMEDNIEFIENATEKIKLYLTQMPKDWDCLFDSDFNFWRYIEGPRNRMNLVYKKSTKKTEQCGGATKGVHFYMVRKKAALKLFERFLPFDNVSDHYLNKLLLELDMNVYWADPPNVHKITRGSSWIDKGVVQQSVLYSI